MSVDSDEEYQVGKSWISVKALQQAADIKAVYRPHQEREDSPPSSLNSSVSTEPTPNLMIHASPSFSNIHEGYMRGAEPVPVARPKVVHRRDSSANTTRMPTQRFTEEYSELRLELTRAQHEVNRLNLELVKARQEHKLDLQKVYAHHERKIQKLRQEFDSSRFGQQNAAFEKQLREQAAAAEAENERLRNDYEDRIEALKVEHELELQAKEETYEKELKSELEELEKKWKLQLEHVEKRHKTELKQFCQPVAEPVVLVDSSRFRRIPRNVQETPKDPQPAKVQQNPDERDKLIEAQAAQIEDLKNQLTAALRRKVTEKAVRMSPFEEDLSASQNLESELKQLISQIE